MARLFLVFFSMALIGCQSAPSTESAVAEVTPSEPAQLQDGTGFSAVENIRPEGRKVLAVGHDLALVKREVVKGSCWDWINRVFNDAGYPNTPEKRKLIHKGKLKTGPYAAVEQIEPGDWLYYVNHSYNGIEHSGIFVRWENRERKQAVMLSYAGEHRNEPGRYRTYDLSNVYRVIRPTD